MGNVYVDFSASNDGDGSTHTQAASPGGAGAYNTLASKTFSSGDKVWIRRQSWTRTATFTFNQAGVTYIGWPKSGDPYYSTRPSGAQAAWDGDSADYATITCTASVTTALVAVATSTGQEFHRHKILQGITAGGSIDAVALSIAADFFACWIENANNGSGTTTPRALSYSGTGHAKLHDCTLRHSGTASGSGTGQGAPVYNSGSGVLELIGCAVEQTNTSWNPTSSLAGMVVNNSASGTIFLIDTTVESSATNYAGKSNSNGLVNAATGGAAVFLRNVAIATDSTAQSCSLNSIGAAILDGLEVTFDPVCYVRIASNGARLGIASFQQAVAVSSGYAIDLTGSGITLSGRDLDFASGNGSGDLNPGGSGGNLVLLQDVVFASATPLGAAPGNFRGVFCADFGGTVGLWKFYGPNGTVQSSNVARDAGEAFSLKFDMDSGTAGDALWRALLQTFPGFETIWVTVPSGSHTITVYGAHKGYGATPPNASEVWVDADFLADGSGARREFATSRDSAMVPAALASDASSWTGDSGLTSFKLELAVTAGQDGLVPVRFHSIKRTPSAYFYLDPKAIVS